MRAQKMSSSKANTMLHSLLNKFILVLSSIDKACESRGCTGLSLVPLGVLRPVRSTRTSWGGKCLRSPRAGMQNTLRHHTADRKSSQ